MNPASERPQSKFKSSSSRVRRSAHDRMVFIHDAGRLPPPNGLPFQSATVSH